MKCPFCRKDDQVEKTQFPERGQHYCRRCYEWFNDCCPLSDRPVKVEDLESITKAIKSHTYHATRDNLAGKTYIAATREESQAMVYAKQADATLDSLAAPSDAEQGKYFAFPAVDDTWFRAEFERRFPSLNYQFIETMEEVGGLGRQKYGDNCIEARIKRGDTSRY